MPRPPKYSVADQKKILERLKEPGTSVFSLSKEYGVSTAVLYLWRRKLGVTLPETPRGRSRTKGAPALNPTAENREEPTVNTGTSLRPSSLASRRLELQKALAQLDVEELEQELLTAQENVARIKAELEQAKNRSAGRG